MPLPKKEALSFKLCISFPLSSPAAPLTHQDSDNKQEPGQFSAGDLSVTSCAVGIYRPGSLVSDEATGSMEDKKQLPSSGPCY